MISKQLAEKRDELGRDHKWSIECICDQDIGYCYYHLSDLEKAQDSYLKGFDAAVPLAFAERDRIILELLRSPEAMLEYHAARDSGCYVTTKGWADWLEEELKKRDGNEQA